MFDQYFEEFRLGMMVENHVFESAIDKFNIRCAECYNNYLNGFIAESEVDSIAVTETSGIIDKIKEFFKNIREKIKEFFVKIRNAFSKKVEEEQIEEKLDAVDVIAEEWKNAKIRDDETYMFCDNEKYIENFAKYCDEVRSNIIPKCQKCLDKYNTGKQNLNDSALLGGIIGGVQISRAEKMGEDIFKELKDLADKYELNSSEIYILKKVNVADATSFIANDRIISNKLIEGTIKNNAEFIKEFESLAKQLSELVYFHEDENTVKQGPPPISVSDISQMTTEASNQCMSAARMVTANSTKNTSEYISVSKKKFAVSEFKQFIKEHKIGAKFAAAWTLLGLGVMANVSNANKPSGLKTGIAYAALGGGAALYASAGYDRHKKRKIEKRNEKADKKVQKLENQARMAEAKYNAMMAKKKLNEIK